MKYKSTRNGKELFNSADVIARGLADDGGLYVPVELPVISGEILRGFTEKLRAFTGKKYAFIAESIMRLFLSDFSEEEIHNAVANAYGGNFNVPNVAELVRLKDGSLVLELWHGPTCAFKDMALQILPHLLSVSEKKVCGGKRIKVLVATSGDTGKAALEGFKDVPNLDITVYYPEFGVSDMQKRQMVTQEGSNVRVCAVKGNFDDCQNGVKAIFTSDKIKRLMEEKSNVFSSANSINWGRLLPQIVYYVFSYAETVSRGEINFGDNLNFVVPTGNFGNILAAYYAKSMGVPIGKMICASNKNKVLTDFLQTGVYDRNREFYTTTSPSMDILISSNLERLLYHLSGEDENVINEWFDNLKNDGKYTVSSSVKKKTDELFYAGFCDDNQTAETIRRVYGEQGYLSDTHTAVAFKVYSDYVKDTGDKTKTVIVSTANPYKFGNAVYEAVGGVVSGESNVNEFDILKKLSEKTNTGIPVALSATENKAVRFTECINKFDMLSDFEQQL